MCSRSAVVLVWIAVSVLACDPEDRTGACEPLRVMPLGDSITEAEDGHASYRYWLHRSFVREGRPVDFVGSQSGVYRGAPRHADFDADHEGHWGWTTGNVRRHIDEWARRSYPDVVLLLLGTNDGARDLAATRDNLVAIVSALRAHRPGVAVFLAQVPPVANRFTGGTWDDIGPLNAMLATLAGELDSPRARVVTVDQWTGFAAARNTYDDIHPNESGEQKLAARWQEAVDALMPWDGGPCP